MNNKKLTGGGNILKGLPPTGTNFYGLLGRSGVSRTKAFMDPALPPGPYKISVNFDPFQENTIFNLSGSQNILVVISGSGKGY